MSDLNDEAEDNNSSASEPAADFRRDCDSPKVPCFAQALKESAAVSNGPPRPGMGPCWYVPSGFMPVIFPILGS